MVNLIGVEEKIEKEMEMLGKVQMMKGTPDYLFSGKEMHTGCHFIVCLIDMEVDQWTKSQAIH